MLLLFALAFAPAAHAEPMDSELDHSTLPLNALASLRAGDFAGALAVLAADPDSEQRVPAAERERLRYCAALIELAQANADEGRAAALEVTLHELSEAAPSADAFGFKAGVARESERLRQRLRERNRVSARAKLVLANQLEAARDLDGAANVYKGILETRAEQTRDVAERAELGLERVSRLRTPWQRELTNARASLVTLGFWVFGLAAAWLVLRVAKALLEQFPHAKPRVEIEEVGVPSERKTLATREIIERLLAPEADSEGPAIDTIEDLDRSGLSNISLSTHDFDALRDIASNSERVSVAGLSFTPQQLYALFVPLRRPYSREFNGSLTQTEAGFARLTLKLRAQRATSFFVCESSSREETLAEAADYIAFSTAPWRVSEKWRSFRAYRKALRVLQAAPDEARAERWIEAREFLETAVGFDPHNLAAQYRLGVLLRRLGANSEAASVLARLDAVLVQSPRIAWVGAFVARNPEFPPSVKYDLALCFAKQEGFDSLNKAELILRGLAKDSSTSDAKPEIGPNLGRFALLANGAIAAVLSGKLEATRRDAESKARRQALADEIVALREALEACQRDPRLADPRTCSSSLAVALAAEGRACYLLGDYRRAEHALRAARAENPKLACAAVHLAQVCSKQAKSHRPELVDEAIGLLERALALSPRNAKANFLLGSIQLYQRKQYEVAATYLQEARKWGHSEKADLVYAECLCRRDMRRDALDVLAQSLHHKEEPSDYRYELFLHCLADELELDPELDAELVRFAEVCFHRLEKAEVKPATLERCREYWSRVQAARAGADESVESTLEPTAPV